MWSDGRGRYYEVFPSGAQDFGVRTSDATGRVVRCTKHLIKRETRTGKFLWQGGRHTFELDTLRAPDCLVWRRRSGGRDFTWKPLRPPSTASWPYHLQAALRGRADMLRERPEAKAQERDAALLNNAGHLPDMALCESSRNIQERVDARLACKSSALDWLEAGRQLKEQRGGCASEASSADLAVIRVGAHGVAYVDIRR